MNGDFESGTATGWSESGITTSDYSVSAPAIDGNYSLDFNGSGSWSQLLETSLTEGVSNGTASVSFDFNASDSGSASTRSLAFYFENGTSGRINLRLNGEGVLQAYDGIGWQEMVTGISFDTDHSLTLTATDIGTESQAWTVKVDGRESSSVQYFDNQSSFSFDTLTFNNNTGAYSVDNIQVVPEPATFALFGLGASLAMFGRRIRAR